jgi:hypothetical protein
MIIRQRLPITTKVNVVPMRRRRGMGDMASDQAAYQAQHDALYAQLQDCLSLYPTSISEQYACSQANGAIQVQMTELEQARYGVEPGGVYTATGTSTPPPGASAQQAVLSEQLGYTPGAAPTNPPTGSYSADYQTPAQFSASFAAQQAAAAAARAAVAQAAAQYAGPYIAQTPAPQTPAPQTPTPQTPTPQTPAVVTDNWFTDEMISGVPNWALVAAAGAVAFLVLRGRK